MPISSAARMIRVSLGTEISTSSIVTVIKSSARAGRCGASVMSVSSCEGGGLVGGSGCTGAEVEVLVPEVLNRGHDRARRAVAEGAERATKDVGARIEQGVQVLPGASGVGDPFG